VPERDTPKYFETKTQETNVKKLLTTLALLTVVGTPAFAQYNPKDYQDPAHPTAMQHQRSVGQHGFNAFAMVPRGQSAPSSLDDPSLTGGGSVGYNEMIRSY
jgi:hypothetical protein